MAVSKVHQAARAVMGNCPDCGFVVVLLNDYETWPLAECRCGWAGGTTDLLSHARLERQAPGERGSAKLAVLVAVVATLVIGAAPVYNPGAGWVRLALAVGLVAAVLLAQLMPEDNFDRHIRTCRRCRNFEGGCQRWNRLVARSKARGEWMVER